jgi:hypothetical protein
MRLRLLFFFFHGARITVTPLLRLIRTIVTLLRLSSINQKQLRPLCRGLILPSDVTLSST